MPPSNPEPVTGHPAEVVPSPTARATWIAAAVAVPLVLMVFDDQRRTGGAQPRPLMLAGKPAPAIEATDTDGLPCRAMRDIIV